MPDTIYDTIILGGGPAGYSAALYSARAGLNTLVLEMLSAGGQMTLTEIIENYPGYADGVDGFTLGEQMQKQAEKFGAVSKLTEVTGIEVDGPVKTVHTADLGDFQTRTIMVATGANARKLDIPSMEPFQDKGIHYCAACDGMRFRGKTVVLVGGGNTALEDALYLSRICEKVYVVHRRDTYRAEKLYVDGVKAADNIEEVLNSTVEGPLTKDGAFAGVQVRNKLDGKLTDLPAEALFVSIGRIPNTGIVPDSVKKDAGGYLVADETTCTSVPGVFAIGDVRTKPLRQIITAAADGAVASVFAQRYVEESK